MTRYLPLFVAALLLVLGAGWFSVGAGLIVASVCVVALWLLLVEVPDAED